MLQFPCYYYLNKKVEEIMAPVTRQPIVVEDLEVEIPGSNLENLQLSFEKDYLAYQENGVLKVYNLTQKKVVFEKAPQGSGEYDLGVIYYQWLPDRDTLVYYYARTNPNPTTVVEVPIEEPTEQGDLTSPEPDAVEDPNQANTAPVTTKPKTRKEIRYNNPQLTEIYTLELPPSDETETLPDDRYNRDIESFPAGGKIKQMVVSTFTNLLYLGIENKGNFQLMEIDIMKNVRNLNHAGEVLTQMAASDKFGTLYAKSKVGKTEKIIALQGWKRETISADPNDIILGNREGTLYLGTVQDNNLVQVRKAKENSEDKDLKFETIWEGSIPYNELKGILVGIQNEIILYNDQAAYIIEQGKDTKIELNGEENIISSDGVEVVQVTRTGTSTLVKLYSLR